jgi:hypothetical protein
MSEQTELLQLIRSVMKSPSSGKAVQSRATKIRELEKEHGKLGDFSRSNSNPTSRAVRDSAFLGYEEVPKTRLTRKDERTNVVDAQTEMIRKAVRIAINTSGGAPSKRAAKRMASPKMSRSDRVFKTAGPGSSRSATLDAIKAIASEKTGCIVRDPKQAISAEASRKNSNTTQGNYNPMIVE